VNASIEYQVAMSSSTVDSSIIPLRRKRTATERVTENGDPLLAKKKARESAQMAPPALVRDASDTYQFLKANPSSTANPQADHCYHKGCFQAYSKGVPTC
jgi:hypothetical protein